MSRGTTGTRRERKTRYIFVRFQQAAAAVALAEERSDGARAALLLLDADDFDDQATAASHLATLRSPAPDGGRAAAAMQSLSRLSPRMRAVKDG